MKQRLTLMCRDRELLDFEVDPARGVVESAQVLDESCRIGGPGAPSFVREGTTPGSLEGDLQRLIRRRCLHHNREDLSLILQATSAKSPFELALRTHGCSLSDQYWYRPYGSQERWADVNFYDNGWDPAFGEAMLLRDWRALARASLETPDITCSGWMRKAWVLDGGVPRLYKASPASGVAFLEGDVIVSRMLSRILAPGEFTCYRKVRRYDEDFVVCDHMLGPTEELVPADALIGPVEYRYLVFDKSAKAIRAFKQVLDDLGVAGTSRIAARTSVATALALARDLHPLNFGVIRNVETGVYRAAPLYDYGDAFGLGLSQQDSQWLSRNPLLTALFLISKGSVLDSDWDYSWFDPQALQGFDEELECALSAIVGLPAGYPHVIAQAFAIQLDYVREVALGK